MNTQSDALPIDQPEEVYTTFEAEHIIDNYCYQKGVRKCTKYHLYNFLSYKNMNTHFKAFTCAPDANKIPVNIQKAINIPGWINVIN